MKRLASCAAALGLLYVYFAGAVRKDITQSDIDAINQLSVENICKEPPSFEQEVICIQAIQLAIRKLVPNMECAGKGTTIEPAQFLQRGFGCCYDRARFTEKAPIHYGFETRHVALYQRDAYGLSGIFVPNISSHATTEVKTQKGWMGVDANEPFILITKDNKVTSYRKIKEQSANLLQPVTPKDFYDKRLFTVYGLYSRHGQFHGLNLPAPEFNVRELLYNLNPD